MPISNSKIGQGTLIYHDSLVNIYGCDIGMNCKIGTFVEVQAGAKIGNNCKISSHTFICEGVNIGDNVFVGHGVMFINDRLPKATHPDGTLLGPSEWKLEETHVGDGASIGSGAVIMCGIRIGKDCLIGAGAVVTKSLDDGMIVAGVPARQISK